MAISIEDPEVEALARRKARSRTGCISDDLKRIGERCSALPVLDDRTSDEILGYEKRGLPA